MEIKQIQIVDYARVIGYTPLKIGSYYTLREHDSVRIHEGRNIYVRNSTGGRGSIIDFVMEFEGKTTKEAIATLEQFIGIEHDWKNSKQVCKRSPVKASANPIEAKQKALQLPPRGENVKRVFAYLIQTRGIDKEIVSDLVKKKQLYQDERGNCVFVSYKKGKPAFGCLRSSHPCSQFKGDVAGSNYAYGFYQDNQSSRLVVAESVIDLLSLQTMMKAEGKNLKEYNFLAICSVNKLECILNHVQRDNIKEMTIGLDNDMAGKKGVEKAIQLLRKNQFKGKIQTVFPTCKDWNVQLLKKDIEAEYER